MIKIISDSTCDLPQALIEKHHISILPLHIHLGEQEFEDGIEISPDEIYAWADANETTPKTSAFSISDAMDLFKPYIEGGDELICFSISNSMSASGRVMRLAAEELEAEDRVHVIDSANLSTGIALLILEAAEMIENGSTASDIVARMEELKPLVRSSFVVDTLTYLHRGGRCSSVAALAGGLLRLHPRISVENGAMNAGKKYRGKMSSVMLSYVQDMEEALKAAKRNRVFITHSGCDEEILASVQQYLESLQVFDEILLARAGGVISSHCGPGTLGVLFIAGE